MDKSAIYIRRINVCKSENNNNRRNGLVIGRYRVDPYFILQGDVLNSSQYMFSREDIESMIRGRED